MGEMRRVGGGTQPTTGRSRTAGMTDRHRLAQRVTQGYAAQPGERTVTAPPAQVDDDVRPAEPVAAEAPATNGHNGKTVEGTASKPEDAAASALTTNAVAEASAAQMPNEQGISEQRRKLRLLDRLTGVSKS